MQAAFERDVGVGDDEPAFECDGAGQVQEEALAGTISADDEANGRTAVLDALEVLQDGADLIETSDLKVAQTNTGNDAGPQRLKDCITLSRLDRIGHQEVSRSWV